MGVARRIFFGDVHGECEKLIDLIKDLRVNEDDELVFMGDYIDKGSESKKVFDLLIELDAKVKHTRFLWGNHDLMFYDWLTCKNPLYGETYDGMKTIKQFIPEGVNIHKGKAKVLKEYGELFEKFEPHVEYPEHIAVHGGLNLTKEDPLKDTNIHEKVNTRMFVTGSPLKKPLIIGHTPQPSIMLTRDRKMVNIDTGCGSGGDLSALIYLKDFGVYTDSNGFSVDVLPLSEY